MVTILGNIFLVKYKILSGTLRSYVLRTTTITAIINVIYYLARVRSPPLFSGDPPTFLDPDKTNQHSSILILGSTQRRPTMESFHMCASGDWGLTASCYICVCRFLCSHVRTWAFTTVYIRRIISQCECVRTAAEFLDAKNVG